MSALASRGKASMKTRFAEEQKRAYHRLQHLYEISKHLVAFKNVEQGFPKILSIAAETFPLTSAVLIEKRGKIPKTTIWPTRGFDEKQIKSAISHAREAYSYLVGSTPSQSTTLSASKATKGELNASIHTKEKNNLKPDKFFVLPIVLDGSSVFGVLQFEISGPVNENDLSFMDALTNLIAATLERHYGALDERAFHKTELVNHIKELQESRADVIAGSLTLMHSQKRISHLEMEQTLRERFVSTLSHDLRTPLTAVRMSAQLILRKPSNAKNSRLLADKIVHCIDRVDQMIKDLLDANSIRAGQRLKLDMNICNLKMTVIDTLNVLRDIHGNRLVLETDQDEVWGYWNSDGLRRVIENLVNNAVKYGASDRPITVKIKQSKHNTWLSVHNEGSPIPQQEQAGLFHPFQRGNAAKTNKKTGWGLGLSLVQGMVDAQ